MGSNIKGRSSVYTYCGCFVRFSSDSIERKKKMQSGDPLSFINKKNKKKGRELESLNVNTTKLSSKLARMSSPLLPH